MRLFFDGVPGEPGRLTVDEQKAALLGRMSGTERGSLIIALSHEKKTLNWSREHAQFDWDGTNWTVTLMGGVKPTHLNGQRLERGKAVPLQAQNTLACDGVEIRISREIDLFKTGASADQFKTGAVADQFKTGATSHDAMAGNATPLGEVDLTELRGRTARISPIEPSDQKTMPLNPMRLTNGQLVSVSGTAAPQPAEAGEVAAKQLERARGAADLAEKAAREARVGAEDAKRARARAEDAYKAVRETVGMVKVRATAREAWQAAQDAQSEAHKARLAADDGQVSAKTAREALQKATDQAELAQQARDKLTKVGSTLASAAVEHARRAHDAMEQALTTDRDADEHARAATDAAERAEGQADEARRTAQTRKSEDQDKIARSEELAGLFQLYGGLFGALFLAAALGMGLAYLLWRMAGPH